VPAFLVTIGCLVLAPLVRLQALALSDGAHGYRKVAGLRNLWRTLATTLYLALGSVVLALVLGTLLALFSVQLSSRWRWLGVVPLLPIVIPPVASVTGWTFLLAPRAGFVNGALRKLPFLDDQVQGPFDIYSTRWIVLVTGLGLTSFVYLFVRAGLVRISYELTEAALVNGATARTAFVSVVLPLLRPSLVYGGAVTFLLGLGQFTAPLLLGTRNNVRVLTTEVYRFSSESPVDYGLSAAIASPLLVVGIWLVVLQRVLLSNQGRFVSEAGKGSPARYKPRKLAPVVFGAYGFVAIVLPVLALFLVALSPFWKPDIDWRGLSFDNFRTVLETSFAARSIRTSLGASTLAVAIVVPLGYIAAGILYSRRGRDVQRTALDFLVNLPLGVPALVFGAGALYTFINPPVVLYGTIWAIMIVYVTLMLPFATRMFLSARLSQGDAYEGAARVAGAGFLTAHLTIVVPMLRSAAAGAVGLTFVLLSHEFAASLLVKSTRTHLMGTALYEFWSTGSYTVTAAMAIIMCVVTTLGVLIAWRLGFDRASHEDI
jgi:iron(III) transport system permease protein